MRQPLDKGEAVVYGRCVDAAYALFKRAPQQLQPEPGPKDIPDRYELVAWVNMSDFILGDEIPKFYGFVARNTTDRHDYILAIRGTEGLVEWLDDAAIHLVPFTQVPHAGRVSNGFDKIYSTLKVVRCHGAAVGELKAKAAALPESLSGTFAEQLEKLADSLEAPEIQERMRATPAARPRRTFVVTGHSLGAALATLFVLENKDKNKFDVTTICTFASPRVGNMQFARMFNQFPINSWRIVNTQDIVPRVPPHIPTIADYEHVETPYEFSSSGKVKWNPVCWHSMSTYLNWLDPSIQVDDQCKP
ncbi:MAG TPA: lipase family protein [Candidatus Sulfotelmatobacter sp.]|nr:lipase family protein [Candidatus Sulfotelmatobacter sp.]